MRVAGHDVIGENEGDGFLFQWGRFGRTYEVYFTRQYVLRNEDIQQVNLTVKFAGVEASQLFRAITAADAKPLSYETSQEDVD